MRPRWGSAQRSLRSAAEWKLPSRRRRSQGRSAGGRSPRRSGARSGWTCLPMWGPSTRQLTSCWTGAASRRPTCPRSSRSFRRCSAAALTTSCRSPWTRSPSRTSFRRASSW
eukprot:PRCOL_00001462-RA